MRLSTFLPTFATLVAARPFVELPNPEMNGILDTPRNDYGDRDPVRPNTGGSDGCLHTSRVWPIEGRLALA